MGFGLQVRFYPVIALARSCFAGDSEAMQGLAIYGMPCVERQWQQNGELPQALCDICPGIFAPCPGGHSV